jgi:hypothetical protein
VDADVAGAEDVGALAGVSKGTVAGCHASGSVSGTRDVGGLVGENGGRIERSHAAATVTASSRHYGGLVGKSAGGTILAAYAAGAVTGSAGVKGGLVGWLTGSGSVTASYATGSVSSGGSDIGGLVGSHWAFTGTVTNSYWDTEATGQSNSVRGTGKTTAELQSPTGYAGIYADWNLDLDGDGVADDPWDFGRASQYPALKADLDGDGEATVTEFGGGLGHQALRAGLTLSETALAVAEAGAEATYTVALVSAPTADVTVTVASGDTDVATVSPSSLTFTPTDWAEAQEVTVTGVDDRAANVPDRTVTVTHTVTSADLNYRGIAAPSVAVTATDDDVALLALSATPDALAESADATDVEVTATLTGAVLDADLDLPLALGGTAQAGVDYLLAGAKLPVITITKGETSASATLRLTPVDDAIDEGASETVAVGVAPHAAKFAGASPAVVELTDDDAAGLTLSLSPATLAESGNATEVTVTAALANAAAGSETVLQLAFGGVAERGADYALAGTESITIAPGATEATTVLTVTPAADGIDEGSGEALEISTAHGGGTVAATLFLADADAGPPGLTIELPDGYSGSDALPVRFVFTEAATGFVGSDVTVTGGTLASLATADGGRVWTAEVTPDAPLPDSVTVEVAANAAADREGDAGPAADVSATANRRGVAVSRPSLTVAAGATATYAVSLASRPAGAVTVTVASDDASVATASPSSLTFRPSDWPAAQAVTVAGVAAGTAQVTHAVASAADAGYHGLAAPPVAVAVVEPIDYDADDDGLIEISTLEQLNAVRFDLDGDGDADSSSNDAAYAAAFPTPAAAPGTGDGALGCSASGSPSACAGYELTADLDFNDDASYANAGANKAGWTTGAGWAPIADGSGTGHANHFRTTFEGNGHVVANLRRTSGRWRA